MADIIVPIGGWSRFGWGEMPWGQTDLPKATGNVGSASVTADANTPVTGLQATASVGSVSIEVNIDVRPDGVSSSGQVGSVATVAEANTNVTGLSGSSSVGSVTVTCCWIVTGKQSQR